MSWLSDEQLQLLIEKGRKGSKKMKQLEEKSLWIAMAILFIMFAYLMCHAEEMVYTYDGVKFIECEKDKEFEDLRERLKGVDIYLTPQERDYYYKRCEKFLKDGYWCLDQAERLCWYLPTRAKKDFTRTTIHATIQSLAGKDMKSRIVAACTTAILDYFDHVIDEWREINDKLYWAKYYFEMAEWYQDLLFRDSVT